MKYLILIILFSLACSLTSVQAKDIDDYLELLDSHPSVQRVLQEKEALEFQADGALGLPDPILSLGVENIPITDPSFDQYLPSSKTVGFSQNIPNPSQRKAQKSIYTESAQVQKLVAEYSRTRLSSLFYIKLAELQRIDELLFLEKEKKLVIEELKQFYQGEVVAGESVFQKTFTIELESSEVEKRVNDLQSEKRVVEATFVQLVGEVPELQNVQYSEKLWSGNVATLYPVILAEQKIRVADERVKLLDTEFNPDFGVAATYKNREEGQNDSFDGDDWFSLQIRMTLPLWAASNQEPKLASAKSRKRSALYELEDVKRSWQMQMATFKSRKEASLSNITILNNKKRALEQSIEALENTYASGQTTLEPILMAQLSRLTLLARIAREEESFRRHIQEANAHIYIGSDS